MIVEFDDNLPLTFQCLNDKSHSFKIPLLKALKAEEKYCAMCGTPLVICDIKESSIPLLNALFNEKRKTLINPSLNDL